MSYRKRSMQTIKTGASPAPVAVSPLDSVFPPDSGVFAQFGVFFKKRAVLPLQNIKTL